MINLGLGSSINWADEPKIGINDKSKVGTMIIDQLKSSITNMLALFLIDIFNHQKKKFTCTVINCPLLLCTEGRRFLFVLYLVGLRVHENGRSTVNLTKIQ